ncbi:MAG: bifunctional diaminohydroxyphosphoribosylaminopyrimidine deaminase/5-amino-6-(5-phosphoribosylamino)uracil reductase RibD [Planctomycetaceae bacterium]|nr:bifunctional diaminohydroxyphosphoribosylaminopyrimidine deaminase/5-amino-6-(5-phosphoribosylamino)uracil reductase RibD [Planctomycetaceae bacterium]
MATHPESNDAHWMTRAIQLARQGEGFVEPNPMVGCVIVATHETDGTSEVIGEGWHRAFGGAHAEVEAIQDARSKEKSTVGATAYVTLEPCCHDGKTPPCTLALLDAGIKRVVVAMRDPFDAVDGGGLAQLQEHGVEVTLGCHEAEARELNAPYLTRIEQQRPWVIAKWAMTLDGKIATRSGSSDWISSEASRQAVHRLRARSDAILIGSRTAATDDPLLTVRLNATATGNDDSLLFPHRTPLRVVFDSQASLSPSSRLAQTVCEAGVLVATSREALDTNETSRHNAAILAERGCEVLPLAGVTHHERMVGLLRHLAQRGVTNLLTEGGGMLLGTLLDLQFIDEVHVFIAPKLVGGRETAVPIGGLGLEQMRDAIPLRNPVIETIGTDVYLYGRIAR